MNIFGYRQFISILLPSLVISFQSSLYHSQNTLSRAQYSQNHPIRHLQYYHSHESPLLSGSFILNKKRRGNIILNLLKQESRQSKSSSSSSYPSPQPLHQSSPRLNEDSITVKSKNETNEKVSISDKNTSTYSNDEAKLQRDEMARDITSSFPQDTTTILPNESLASSSEPFQLPPYVTILTLCWFVSCLSSLDRVAMSVAMIPLSSEYHLSDSIKGQISSIFSIGYGIGIIPIGLLISSASTRWIMATGVFMWSLATIGTPIAASLIQVVPASISTNVDVGDTVQSASLVAQNVAPLLLIRSIMGGAESVVLPTIQKILSKWVPQSQKSLAVAIVISGFQFGTIAAYLFSPWIIDALNSASVQSWLDGLVTATSTATTTSTTTTTIDGWEGMFYIYGAVGLLWLLPWLGFAEDEPPSSTNLPTESISSTSSSIVNPSSSKTDSIVSNADDKHANVIMEAPWKELFQSPAIWGMTVAHAANNWGLYNSLSWTPTFYAEQYGLNVKDSALFSIIPSVAGAVAGLSAGFIADKVLEKYASNTAVESIVGADNSITATQLMEERRTQIRKIFQGIALLMPAACLLTLSSNIPQDPFAAQLLLTGTVGFQAFNAAGYGAAPQEKAGAKWSGLLYSVTTLPGVMVGSLGVYVTGVILDNSDQNWSQVFALNGLVDIVGAIAFIILYNSRKEFD